MMYYLLIAGLLLSVAFLLKGTLKDRKTKQKHREDKAKKFVDGILEQCSQPCKSPKIRNYINGDTFEEIFPIVGDSRSGKPEAWVRIHFGETEKVAYIEYLPTIPNSAFSYTQAIADEFDRIGIKRYHNQTNELEQEKIYGKILTLSNG